jgi:hypothetical protein
MNASRRVLRASTNTVKSLYNFGQKSMQGYLIETTIIVILIVLTAIVLKFLPLKFLCFFNNIIVKVIFLIIIAFVALYCPAIGLMLAILLVSIIQMCQRKQLSLDIDNIKNNRYRMKNMQPDMNIFESLDSGNNDTSNEEQNETFKENYDDNMIEGYDNKNREVEQEPIGFNDDTSCMAGCGGSGSNGGKDSQRELDGMCGNVKTWKDQMSAQGLDGEIVGLQSSIGYPI